MDSRGRPSAAQEMQTRDPKMKDNTVRTKKRIILHYRGQIVWSKEYGIDSRIWDVVSPRLSRYNYSSGGYPTFTIDGLKKEKLI